MEYKMIKKEINEIKSQYTLEECGILRLCGCYVNGDKEKVARFNQTFLNLPEEEKHKYFDIFRKTLSGTPGKNLLDMRFTMDSYADGGARTFLYQLRDSELKDDALLEKFYDKVIESYSHPGNYLILLINQVYDVPGRTSDGIDMEDASDEVYSYLLCSICHSRHSAVKQFINKHICPACKRSCENNNITIFYSPVIFKVSIIHVISIIF